MFDPTKTDQQLIVEFEEQSIEADVILRALATNHPTDFRKVLIDLDDMQMAGAQIYAAYEFCGHDPNAFIYACAHRDVAMVGHVNAKCAGRIARQHGPQKTLPPIDGAVRSIFAHAEKEGVLQRLDEGADAVHDFFMTLLTEMQKRRSFVTNFRLNLAAEGYWGVFAIQLTDIVDRDGNTIQMTRNPDTTPTISKTETNDDHVATSSHSDRASHADDAVDEGPNGGGPIDGVPSVGVHGDTGGTQLPHG